MWKKRDMEVGRRMASIGVLSKPIGVRSQVKKSPCLSQFVQGSCPDWPFPSICITFFLYLVYSFTEPQKLPDLRSHSILECNIHMYIGVCVFVHVCGLQKKKLKCGKKINCKHRKLTFTTPEFNLHFILSYCVPYGTVWRKSRLV